MGLLSLIPVVESDKCMKALAPLRDMYPKIVGEILQTMRLEQVAKTSQGDL